MYYVLYLVQCQAVRGSMAGRISHMVGKTPTEYDCAALVKRLKPLAKGMSYSPKVGSSQSTGSELCWARDGPVVPSANSDQVSCVFGGKLFDD